MRNKKFIFVTGPSESGKSGGINYIADSYPDDIKHLKIRNIFPEVYKDSNSDLEFQEWYDTEYENNFEQLWDKYIEKADEMSGDKKIVIMDTMYGVKTIKYLFSKLKEDLGVLYIDANFNNRVLREFQRLRTDSTRGTRKADLSITIEQVIEKTKKKDESKGKKETFEYKSLVYSPDSEDILVGNRETSIPFSYVINNDGSLEEFHEALDEFAVKEIGKRKNSSGVVKKYTPRNN